MNCFECFNANQQELFTFERLKYYITHHNCTNSIPQNLLDIDFEEILRPIAIRQWHNNMLKETTQNATKTIN